MQKFKYFSPKKFGKIILKILGFSLLFCLYVPFYIWIWLLSVIQAELQSKETFFDKIAPLDTKATRERKREEIESRQPFTKPLNNFFILAYHYLKKW